MKGTISKIFFSAGLAAMLITSTPLVKQAKAGPEPFVGEIMMHGFNFAPRNWAFCDGQLLSIAQNSALFSLLGTTFGGDGRTTFGLPDLRGRVAIHPGTGPGLPPISGGQRGGAATHTLTIGQMPSHSHNLVASDASGNSTDPTGRINAVKNRTKIYTDAAPNVEMSAAAIAPNGGGQAFGIMQPFLGVYHSIALVGVFPSRN